TFVSWSFKGGLRPRALSLFPTRRSSDLDAPAMTEPQRPARKAGLRKMTQRRLENIARFYIERFATTSAHLRRVLARRAERARRRSEEHTSELQSRENLVCRRLLEKRK